MAAVTGTSSISYIEETQRKRSLALLQGVFIGSPSYLACLTFQRDLPLQDMVPLSYRHRIL